jgi:hypothetical protein
LQSVGIDLESLKTKLVAVTSILLRWFSRSMSYGAAPKNSADNDECEALYEMGGCQPPVNPEKAPDKRYEEMIRRGTIELLGRYGGDEGEQVRDPYHAEEDVDAATTESNILSLIDGLKEGVISVDYSCTFMKSAINRSLDFTKATKNIALSPSVSPFNIRDTLTWPLKVLHCSAMCCAVVWCAVLCCGVLWCAVVWCGVVCCGVLCCAVLLHLSTMLQFP